MNADEMAAGLKRISGIGVSFEQIREAFTPRKREPLAITAPPDWQDETVDCPHCHGSGACGTCDVCMGSGQCRKTGPDSYAPAPARIRHGDGLPPMPVWDGAILDAIPPAACAPDFSTILSAAMGSTARMLEHDVLRLCSAVEGLAAARGYDVAMLRRLVGQELTRRADNAPR